MSIWSKSIWIFGLIGFVIFIVVSDVHNIRAYENKWFLHCWIALIVFLHLLLAYFTGEIELRDYIVKRAESLLAYWLCMAFMAILVIYFLNLAYDFFNAT